MKSLVRWGTTWSLVGSTLLASVLSTIAPVLALSEEKIQEKLGVVPVHLITNESGSPLSRTLPAGQNGKKPGSVTQVFMSQQEAKQVMQQLQQQKPKDPKMAQMLGNLQVTTTSLGIIYDNFRKTANQPNRLLFAFKPEDREVKGAIELLRKNGQQVKNFPSIPIFLVKFAPDKGYVPIEIGPKGKAEQVIPLFLSKQDAQTLVNQIKPKYPKAEINVVDVDGVLKILRERNDKWLEKVVFFPSPEARQYIQSLSRQGNANSPKKK